MSKDKAGNDLASDEVFIVKMTIFNMWVCAPKHMTQQEVQEFIDMKSAIDSDLDHGWTSGTSENWIVQHDPDNAEESLRSPGLCAEDCNRQHWNCHC